MTLIFPQQFFLIELTYKYTTIISRLCWLIERNIMNIQDFLVQQASAFGFSDLSDNSIINSLKAIGLTDNDLKKYNQYWVKLFWRFGLEGYSQNCILPTPIKTAMQVSIVEIKDFQMQYDMQDFLNYPTYAKGKNLYNKISSSIPQDITKDFYEIITKLRKHLMECQGQQNRL